jgi:hypothetical protein
VWCLWWRVYADRASPVCVVEEERRKKASESGQRLRRELAQARLPAHRSLYIGTQARSNIVGAGSLQCASRRKETIVSHASLPRARRASDRSDRFSPGASRRARTANSLAQPAQEPKAQPVQVAQPRSPTASEPRQHSPGRLAHSERAREAPGRCAAPSPFFFFLYLFLSNKYCLIFINSHN